MSSSGNDILLSKAEQERIQTLLEKASTVSDYAGKTAEFLAKGKGLAEAILHAAPWLKDIAESAAEALPLANFVAKLLEKWLPKATHPAEVGAVACTLVYQKLADKAIRAVCTSALQYGEAIQIDDRAAARIKALPPAEAADLSTFSYDNAFQHAFLRRADKILEELMIACQFKDDERRRIFDMIHDGFVPELKNLLADTKTAPKFASFKAFLDSGSDERQALVALHLHAKYQIAQYETEPLFKREPYALKNVYVETECGKLTWKDIRPAQDKPGHGREMAPQTSYDPFSENHGGRHDLLTTVMEYIKDVKFREAIVVQGIAGAGKSSFTLRLCAKLWEEGFHPLRIRFKRLHLGNSLFAALQDALELIDDDRAEELPIARPKDMLRGGDVFHTPWGGAPGLSRYVLILDGWDELDLTDSKSFRDKVDRVLNEVRQRLLDGQKTPRVRVIVTGRPSPDVSESRFLHNDTPILTLRPMRPEQLQDFIVRVRQALVDKPVAVAQPDEWTPADPSAFAKVNERYQAFFDSSLPEYDTLGNMTRPGAAGSSGSFEVLGLPLLAYLTLRVLSEMAAREADLDKRAELFEQIGNEATTLYRWLTDLTCEKAGKAVYDLRDVDDDLKKQARETGMSLRKKLQWTAAAMTISGKEYVSFAEWARRVRAFSKDHSIRDVGNDADHPLAKLMISYYFQGGHRDQSCEFAHKSFREYFFAEAIVETLKGYGATGARPPTSERHAWRDFPAGEDLFEFSRSLAELLAPQWLTGEVYRHLESLLRWEIGREQGAVSTSGAGLETSECTLDMWQQIGDGLAHVWTWWVDGAHLRPQIVQQRTKTTQEPPYVLEMIDWAAAENKTEKTPLESTTNVDAHLGDGLCQLTAMVHSFVAQGQQARGITIRRFAPGGPGKSDGFRRIQARIASASGRPRSEFPRFTYLVNTDLSGADLSGADLSGADLSGADLRGANLRGANLRGADLTGADLRGANLIGANLIGANLIGANLSGANLSGANLSGAYLSGAYLIDAYLSGAHLSFVRGLSWEQIHSAQLDATTQVPKQFEERFRAKLAHEESP